MKKILLVFALFVIFARTQFSQIEDRFAQLAQNNAS